MSDIKLVDVPQNKWFMLLQLAHFRSRRMNFIYFFFCPSSAVVKPEVTAWVYDCSIKRLLWMWWRHPLLVLVELVWFNGSCLYPHSHAHILHSYQALWIIYSERSVGLTIYWKGALTGNHARTVFCVRKKVCTQPPALTCTFHFRCPLAAPRAIQYNPYHSFIVMCHSVGKLLCFRLRHVLREAVGTSQAAKRPTCLPRNIFFPHHLVLIQISRNASEPRYRLKVRIPPQMHHHEWYLSLRRVIRRSIMNLKTWL